MVATNEKIRIIGKDNKEKNKQKRWLRELDLKKERKKESEGKTQRNGGGQWVT